MTRIIGNTLKQLAGSHTMDNKIFHNPRCTKSRQTLSLLEERGIEVPVVEYLTTPPSESELTEICKLLGVHPTGILRSKEPLFKDLGLALTDERSAAEWISIMSNHPKLIERPIVIIDGKAAVGRPPENILSII